jgi:hypothetical protein
MNFSDLKEYNYSKRITVSEKLAKSEILNIIKEFAKNKTLDLNEISNKVFKHVVNVILTLLIRIFQIYIN